MPTYIRNVLQLFQHRLINDHFGKESIEVNDATKLLSEALLKAGECMSFSCRPKEQIANKTWFDDECFTLKFFLNRSLRQYIGSQEVDDKSVYLSKRRIYKTLLREKKKFHSLKVVAEIERNIGDSKLFWQNIKRLSEKRKLTTCISKDDWYVHFFNVFNLININSEETGNNIVVDIQPI